MNYQCNNIIVNISYMYIVNYCIFYLIFCIRFTNTIFSFKDLNFEQTYITLIKIIFQRLFSFKLKHIPHFYHILFRDQ